LSKEADLSEGNGLTSNGGYRIQGKMNIEARVYCGAGLRSFFISTMSRPVHIYSLTMINLMIKKGKLIFI
jgi:hypothetical protein